jgi:hypothetical protein
MEHPHQACLWEIRKAKDALERALTALERHELNPVDTQYLQNQLLFATGKLLRAQDYRKEMEHIEYAYLLQ